MKKILTNQQGTIHCKPKLKQKGEKPRYENKEGREQLLHDKKGAPGPKNGSFTGQSSLRQKKKKTGGWTTPKTQSESRESKITYLNGQGPCAKKGILRANQTTPPTPTTPPPPQRSTYKHHKGKKPKGERVGGGFSGRTKIQGVQRT